MSKTGCYCQTSGHWCNEGRACPLRETEASNALPLDPNTPFPAPKGNRMNDYRNTSGAWTGFAPRTTEERWPTPPRTANFDGWFVRFIARLFGR